MEMDAMPFDLDNSPQSGSVYIRISMPDKQIQKCLQFQLDDTVSSAKQMVLNHMGQDLKDPLNYGLFCPPMNGRAGKFLQEERPLNDYPLSGPIGFLEFKYKRRVYRNLQVNLNKLKKLHSKSNLKQFLEYVKLGDSNKVLKWTNKGLDPNFQCRVTGDTPLCLTAKVAKPKEVIMALVSGGAHLDFRAKDSSTPLHRAAQTGNYEALGTLLDLGQSPNCLDSRNLSPLYYTVLNETASICAERLLYEHSIIGLVDDQELQEIHQACKFGRVQHLEHLLSYGADINCVSLNGNSPLHICAFTGQEACVRLLLFRGANRTLVNGNGHTPFQVAILHNFQEVAEIIRGYNDRDIVPIRTTPKFNDKRRRSMSNSRSTSYSHLHSLGQESSKPASLMGTMSLSGSMVAGVNGHAVGSMSKSTSNLAVYNNGGVNSGSVCYNWDMESSYGSISSASSLKGGQLTNLSSYRSSYTATAAASIRSSSLLPPFNSATQNLESSTNVPRTIVLQKSSKGFGFVLRGAKAPQIRRNSFKNDKSDDDKLSDFHPTPEVPALQYLEKVEKGSPAERAGLRPGDYIIEINNKNVISGSHERCVNLIQESGNTLLLKIVTVERVNLRHSRRLHDDLDNKSLSNYEDNRSVALRSSRSSNFVSDGESLRDTASVSNRTSRKITEDELQCIFARGGRDELPITKTTKPEIPQAPRMFSNDSEIRSKLKANISSSRNASQITTAAVVNNVSYPSTPSTPVHAMSVSGKAGSDSGVSCGGSEAQSILASNQSIKSDSTSSYTPTLPRTRQRPTSIESVRTNETKSLHSRSDLMPSNFNDVQFVSCQRTIVKRHDIDTTNSSKLVASSPNQMTQASSSVELATVRRTIGNQDIRLSTSDGSNKASKVSSDQLFDEYTARKSLSKSSTSHVPPAPPPPPAMSKSTANVTLTSTLKPNISHIVQDHNANLLAAIQKRRTNVDHNSVAVNPLYSQKVPLVAKQGPISIPPPVPPKIAPKLVSKNNCTSSVITCAAKTTPQPAVSCFQLHEESSYRNRAEEMRAKLVQRQAPQPSQSVTVDETEFLPPPESFKDANIPTVYAGGPNSMHRNTFFIGSRPDGLVVKEFHRIATTSLSK